MPDSILQYEVVSSLPGLPLVDVVVIDSRSKSGRLSEKWVEECLGSVRTCPYPNLGLMVVDNTDRSLSIGKCWNAAVEASTADFVLFLGDDDFIAFNLPSTLVDGFMYARRNGQGEHLVNVTSGYTAVDEEGRPMQQVMLQHHTGMFVREWLARNKFDETLDKLVDTDMAKRIEAEQQSTGKSMYLALIHDYGYFYRQHPFQVSGQKWVKQPAAPPPLMRVK